MRIRTRSARLARWFAILAVAGGLTACDSLLEVNNPATIDAEDLEDPAMITFMANGVRGEFQRMFNTHVYNVGIFADELVGGHLSWPEPLWDRREIDASHPVNSSLYSSIHAARGSADSLAARMERLLGADAGTSLELADVLAHGGYVYIILAEHFCSSPINLSEPYLPDQLFAMAVERFDRAITIATAAKTAGSPAAAADAVVNLARVGNARAYLGMGDAAQAIQFASAVPAEFEWWVHFTDNPTGLENRFFVYTSTTDLRAALEPPLDTVGDPRIPHGGVRLRLPDGRMMFPPWVPFSFSGWDPAAPKPIARNSNIRLASGLEARYIVAEAGGLSAAEIRQFVDSRRAVGNQGPFPGTDAELAAELREQRRRDLFLTAHRLGDLRRYKSQGIDLFPRGPVPGFQDRVYADQECLLIPQSELSANPKAHN